MPTRRVTALDLFRAGIPRAVVRLVETLRQGPAETLEEFTERLLQGRDASLVRWAVLTDRRHTVDEWLRGQHVRLPLAPPRLRSPDRACVAPDERRSFVE
ncbi:hypothetical protein [Actinoplanes subglobosus]|uniref:Uncharacterized protein n=1 Tax=Actinoplanes subglobosus TaxID=1547892 RepID=A0ABV8IWI0_9ACTN